ncbi:MAG: DNA polymerase III subunit gamma/tau [Flavobacteriales bacterium]|tara:strand:- start:1014 stop:2762 length:1749 start_codon:yes stop_codon:yes gene_type:complete
MSDFVVSARKYRPSTFTDVVGQSAITTTLSKAIKDNHLAQSFLFCGPRGVGKTTCARILAKTINCENISENVEACDTCESCTSFNEQHSFNIHELDAASNNSVDDIRNLVDQVRFAPQVGEYSIYIIDEVHMLSSAAFNAFLKTLEEPPKHAIFILATTEKHKIIPTILSRCQIFDFKSIGMNDIISHLEYVSKSEGINAEKDALHIVAQKAGGSLRDSLSMFDRLVDSTDLSITYKSVIENLNILDHDYYLKITNQIISNDVSSVLLTINEILQNGFDAHQFIMGLASHLRDLLVCKDPQTLVLLDKGEELKSKYLSQSENCELSFLIKALRMCNKCDVEYRASKNQRLLVELTLLKMTTIGQFVSEKKNNNSQIIAPAKKVEVKIKQEIVEEVPVIEVLHKTVDQVEKVEVVVEEKVEVKTVVKEEPLRKVRKSRFSLSDVMDDKKEVETELNAPKKSENFTESKMREVWMLFAEKINKEGKMNLFITLTSSDPTLEEETLINLKISNDAQEKILDENKIQLMDHLRTSLNNDFISLKTELSEDIKSDIPYTPKDKFIKMTEENPHLNTLQQKLGLDPDY